MDYGSSGRFSTCSFSAFAWFNSEYKFLRQSTWLVFLVTVHLALYSFVVLRPLMLDIMGGLDQKDSLEVHRCSSWTRFSTCPLLCYVWCHGPDSAVHCLAFPLLQFSTVVDTPCRYAVAVFHGPVCSENHRGSPVRIWWSMSLLLVLHRCSRGWTVQTHSCSR